jgi:hypothetical protein
MNRGEGTLIMAIRGPIMLIAVGTLFALSQFTAYGFSRTWPVLLILLGVLKLLERAAAKPQDTTGSPKVGVMS